MLHEEATTRKRQSKYYTWTDTQWSSFMVALMLDLEPRKYQAGELIYKDMEEVQEFYFVLQGDVGVVALNIL